MAIDIYNSKSMDKWLRLRPRKDLRRNSWHHVRSQRGASDHVSARKEDTRASEHSRDCSMQVARLE